MDIQELNKTQLILLTLLITFIVSIATGIITVSLMQQVPKSVPQTINNVIQRTIEKVSTPSENPTSTINDNSLLLSDEDALISIYSSGDVASTQIPNTTIELPKALGQGIIISDMGLVLVDSNILTDASVYNVILNKVDFDATLIKKFNNGFSVLKITKKKIIKDTTTETTGTQTVPQTNN